MASEVKVETFPCEKHLVDYQETLRYFHDLAGARFRLLALVPAVTGVALAQLVEASHMRAETVIAVGIFGFLVVLGVMIYDARNTHLYDRMQVRAKNLEAYLGLPRAVGRYKIQGGRETTVYCRGGALLSRPPRDELPKLLGLVRVWHDRGLAIVYSSCSAAWAYIALQGFNGICMKHTPSALAAEGEAAMAVILPTIWWFLLLWQYKRWDTPTEEKDKLTGKAKALLDEKPTDLGFDEDEEPKPDPLPA